MMLNAQEINCKNTFLFKKMLEMNTIGNNHIIKGNDIPG